MRDNLDEKNFREVKELLFSYFPDCRFQCDPLKLELADGGEILSSPEQIVRYMQTILFEEHLLELQLDQSTRIFFAKIVDDHPGREEYCSNDELIIVDPHYTPGSYLKAADSIVITPLTPGIGNVAIRGAKRIVCRFFSGTHAIEFGCTFRAKDLVAGMPVLRLNFPVIGRINKSYRAFRVKSISSVDAYVIISYSDASGAGGQQHQMIDISAMGLGFEVPQEKAPYEVGDFVEFLIDVPGIRQLTVRGNIRHISKVRDHRGYKNICGVQFDLKTRSLAADLEQIASAVQRLQLREMKDKMACQA